MKLMKDVASLNAVADEYDDAVADDAVAEFYIVLGYVADDGVVDVHSWICMHWIIIGDIVLLMV